MGMPTEEMKGLNNKGISVKNNLVEFFFSHKYDFLFQGFEDGLGKFYSMEECTFAFYKVLGKYEKRVNKRIQALEEGTPTRNEWKKKKGRIINLKHVVEYFAIEGLEIDLGEYEVTEGNYARIYGIIEKELCLIDPFFAFY